MVPAISQTAASKTARTGLKLCYSASHLKPAAKPSDLVLWRLTLDANLKSVRPRLTLFYGAPYLILALKLSDLV